MRRSHGIRYRGAPVALALAAAQAFAPALLHAQSPAASAPEASQRTGKGQAETALPEVHVSADASRETATGPVSGYGARRSAAGTKTDTPLHETPASVTVITRDFLRDLQVQDIAESIRYVAGASGGEDGRDGFGAIRLRGFGASPATLRDGTRQNPFNIIPQDPQGLERIEVLKGPTSVLFGQSGPGGLINLVSKRPSSEPIREIDLSLGSWSYRQAAVDLGGPITAGGELALRFNARALKRDDAVDFANEDRRYLAPAIAWQPNARTTVTFLADAVDIKAVRVNTIPIEGVLLPNPNGTLPLTLFIGEPDFDLDDKEQWQAGYQAEHLLNDTWTVRQNARYTSYQAETRTTFSLGIQPNLRFLNRRPVLRSYDGEIFTLDNHVQAQWRSGAWQHTALAGADYLRYVENQIRFNGTFTPLDLFNPVYGATALFPTPRAIDNTRRLRQAGAYAQHQAKYDERWVMLLGVRQDQAKDATTNKLNGQVTTLDDDALTGRAGLLFLSKSGFAPYVSFSQSFNPVSGSTATGEPFKPETGEQVEIGAKYEAPSKRWSAAVALYDLRRQNVPTIDPEDSTNRIQVGEQRHRGVELELAGALTSRLQAVAAFSYIDAVFSKDNARDAAGNPTLQGKTPTRIPERTVSLWARYRLPAVIVDGISVGLGARHVAGVQGNQANTFQVPNYTVWDAGLYFERPGYSVSLTAKNLFDRDYYAAGTSNTNVVAGDPRTVVASVSMRW